MSEAPLILFAFGTRPEIIKLVPIIRNIKERYPDKYRILLCSTEQSKDLLPDTLNDLGIVPDIRFEIDSGNASLDSISANIHAGYSKLFSKIKPNLVVVVGDTLSCLITVLSSFYNQFPVCHIEAGLRSWDLKSPFPEEGFRRIISQIAQYHLATNEGAYNYLISLGLNKTNVFHVQNPIYELVLQYSSTNVSNVPFVLVTQHRRENIPHNIEKICDCLLEATELFPEIDFKIIAHPNPESSHIIQSKLNDLKRVKILNPLPHSEFLKLLSQAALVITDSGGVQEEAHFLGIPTIVTRRSIERKFLLNEETHSMIDINVVSLLLAMSKAIDSFPAKNRHYISHQEKGLESLVGIITDILDKTASDES